jgi:hypothetical protein
LTGKNKARDGSRAEDLRRPRPRCGRVPFSVLDLSPIAQGGTVADALHHSRALAQQAERLGYRRYWLAEHHNLPGIASAATAVVIGHVAAGTDAPAAHLFTSLQQSFVQLRRGTPGPLPPPVHCMDGPRHPWSRRASATRFARPSSAPLRRCSGASQRFCAAPGSANGE